MARACDGKCDRFLSQDKVVIFVSLRLGLSHCFVDVMADSNMIYCSHSARHIREIALQIAKG